MDVCSPLFEPARGLVVGSRPTWGINKLVALIGLPPSRASPFHAPCGHKSACKAHQRCTPITPLGSGGWGTLRSEIKEETEGRGTFAKQSASPVRSHQPGGASTIPGASDSTRAISQSTSRQSAREPQLQSAYPTCKPRRDCKRLPLIDHRALKHPAPPLACRGHEYQAQPEATLVLHPAAHPSVPGVRWVSAAVCTAFAYQAWARAVSTGARGCQGKACLRFAWPVWWVAAGAASTQRTQRCTRSAWMCHTA